MNTNSCVAQACNSLLFRALLLMLIAHLKNAICNLPRYRPKSESQFRQPVPAQAKQVKNAQCARIVKTGYSSHESASTILPWSSQPNFLRKDHFIDRLISPLKMRASFYRERDCTLVVTVFSKYATWSSHILVKDSGVSLLTSWIWSTKQAMRQMAQIL